MNGRMELNKTDGKVEEGRFYGPELKTSLEWDILNPDRIINLEINNKRGTSII